MSTPAYTLNIAKLSSAPESAEQVVAMLDHAGIEWHNMSCHNWADSYPYCPTVRFRAAHTGTALLLNYDVCERSIRAEATTDNGAVWEDSCCELFLQLGEGYYNIECNCGGALLVGYGLDRHNRKRAGSDITSAIDRWSSLGRRHIPLTHMTQKDSANADWHWQLSLIIPVATFCHDSIACLDGLSARCNLYKCGDKLDSPHFLSWRPVGTPRPDFHQPDFFGDCKFL